ncbi:LysR family transcriptional regulator [Salinicoccus jeotgali]|uniref:LysR family transcriptional regulator n=1 Tax=Salinicoccus jeotgali TaxID=381634 RepID=A0ABP7FDB2_9STAP
MDQQLRVFITVAEKKNFSRAAEELHMTQPAVSQYIRALEENFNVRLLERSNKYVRLNKAGEIVYHHAKEIAGLHSRMNLLVDDLVNKVSGPLSIGASYTFGEYVLPHIIAKMKEIYPEVKPAVVIGNTAEIAQSVLRHQLDVGIVEGHSNQDEHLSTKEFAKDTMILVAASNHPLVKQKTEIQIKDLENETWILREKGSGTREAAEKLFHQLDISPKEIMNFGSTQAIKEMIEAGSGVSLLSEWAVQKELRNGDLKTLDIKGLPLARNFFILTNSPFQTKALKVFVDMLHKEKELTEFSKADRPG